MASRLTDSRFAHSDSHTATKESSTSHESATLAAATFTFAATRSSALSGRTATKAGTARSSDQNVGLENAAPTGMARTTGVASAASRRRNVSAASCRTSHDIGMTATRTTAPTSVGSTIPELRHSNQKWAAAGVANGLRLVGDASAIRPKRASARCALREPPARSRATWRHASRNATRARPMASPARAPSERHSGGGTGGNDGNTPTAKTAIAIAPRMTSLSDPARSSVQSAQR